MRPSTLTTAALAALLTAGTSAFAQGTPSKAAGAAHKVRTMLGAKEELDSKTGRYKKVDLNVSPETTHFNTTSRKGYAVPGAGHLQTIQTKGLFGKKTTTHVLTLPNGRVYTSKGGDHQTVARTVQSAIRSGGINPRAAGAKPVLKTPIPVMETRVGASHVETFTTKDAFGRSSTKHTVTLANGRVLNGKRVKATHEEVVRGLRKREHAPEVSGAVNH